MPGSPSATQRFFRCGEPEQVGDAPILHDHIIFWNILELTFPDPMHPLRALEGPLGGMERAKPQPWIWAGGREREIARNKRARHLLTY
jgi:hypothetical protein